MRRLTTALAAFLSALTLSQAASAYTHIVRQGETLASIAEHAYGRIEHEKILVAANALDAQGGSPIVPGMRLEIPAVSYHRVQVGETWAQLAKELLGDERRANILAQANDTVPWVQPVEGQEILVPYNLRYLVGHGETLVTISQKFFGKRERAYILAHYNRREGEPLQRGDVLLIPLTDLTLSEAGKAAALAAEASVEAQAAGAAREAQRKVDAEMPLLAADVKTGRYVEAVARGVRMLSSGELTAAQLASIHRQLLEAYAALEAHELAAASCVALRENDPSVDMGDEVRLSPKIVAACRQAMAEKVEVEEEPGPGGE